MTPVYTITDPTTGSPNGPLSLLRTTGPMTQRLARFLSDAAALWYLQDHPETRMTPGAAARVREVANARKN